MAIPSVSSHGHQRGLIRADAEIRPPIMSWEGGELSRIETRRKCGRIGGEFGLERDFAERQEVAGIRRSFLDSGKPFANDSAGNEDSMGNASFVGRQARSPRRELPPVFATRNCRKGWNTHMNQSKLVGKVDELISVLQSNTATLSLVGIPVNAVVSELKDKKDALVTTEVEQENLKTSLKNKTEEVQGNSSQLYDTFSTKIDAACGAVGKKSNLAKQIARLRSSLRSKKNTDEAQAPSVPKAA